MKKTGQGCFLMIRREQVQADKKMLPVIRNFSQLLL